MQYFLHNQTFVNLLRNSVRSIYLRNINYCRGLYFLHNKQEIYEFEFRIYTAITAHSKDINTTQIVSGVSFIEGFHCSSVVVYGKTHMHVTEEHHVHVKIANKHDT